MFDIWSTENALAEYIYENNNYIIENQITENNLCVIYFSSNNIWFPNNESAFKKAFLENDFYEWKNFKNIKAKKIIFLRDIYKSWYVTGINKVYNSVDKLIEFLKKEAEGMQIVTIGSSAGGYAAALFGALLKANYVLCFSAQFDLYQKGFLNVNSFLQKFSYDPQKEKYYNIVGILRDSRVPIYYFVPAFSEQDVHQMNAVKDLSNVHIIKMRSKHHGVPVYKCTLNNLVNSNLVTLTAIFESYKNELVSPFLFSVKQVGFWLTLNYLFKLLIKVIRKKLFK